VLFRGGALSAAAAPSKAAALAEAAVGGRLEQRARICLAWSAVGGNSARTPASPGGAGSRAPASSSPKTPAPCSRSRASMSSVEDVASKAAAAAGMAVTGSRKAMV